MFQKLGGITDDIIVLVVFIYFSLILLGVIRLKKEIGFFKTNPTISKIVVFGGVLIFTILVIVGLSEP
jgi:hypothetical protein